MEPSERGRHRAETREELLHELYNQFGPDDQAGAFSSLLAPTLGWDEQAVISTAQELVERGLLRLRSSGPNYGLTWDGIDHVEKQILSGVNQTEVAKVQDAQSKRLAMLEFAYERTVEEGDDAFTLDEAERALGLTEYNEAHKISRWLHNHGLFQQYGTRLRLTTEAIDLVEHANDQPDEPAAPGLAAVSSTVVIEGSPGAMVQVNSPGAAQVVVKREGGRVTELTELLDSVATLLDARADAIEAKAALEAVRQQAALGRSDSGVLRAGLGELYDFTKQVGANALGALVGRYLAGS